MMSSKRPHWTVVLAAVCATAACAILARLWFHGTYLETDTGSYLFQARLFTTGRISVATPRFLELAPSGCYNMLRGKLYSQYVWGNPAALAIGVLAGAPWLVPAIETGLTLILACLFVQRAFGRRTAIVTAVLMLMSPAVIGLGVMWMSENTSRLALALYLLGLIDVLLEWRRGAAASSADALMMGVGLGLAVCTRPLTSVAFAVPGALFLLVTVARSRPARASVLRTLVIAGVPFSLFLASLLAYNTALTGRATLMTEAAEQPLVGLGFGPRDGGYFPEYLHPSRYTPHAALSRTLRHTLPGIGFNALGWGRYRPDLFNATGATVESPIAGLEILSQTDGGWIVLALRGASNGRARITLDSSHSDRLAAGVSIPLEGNAGISDVQLHLALAPDGYHAFFRTAGDADWRAVGTVPATIVGPLDVGPVAARVSPRDRFSVIYRDFVVEGDRGTLVSDTLRGGVGPTWRWSREPLEWKPSDSGVQIVSDLHHSLHSNEVQTEQRLGRRLTRLFQTTSGSAIDIRVSAHADWRQDVALPWLRTLPLVVVPLLVVAGVFVWRTEIDWLLAAVAVSNILTYTLFYFEGAVFGSTPIHLRYHNEATVLALLPLTARGLIAIAGRWRDWPAAVRVVTIAGAVLLVANTAATFQGMARDYRNWNGLYQLPMRVAQAGLHHAVVFLPHMPEAPAGDYPLVPLDRADVVYARLGPAPEWGLPGRTWQEIYREQFAGWRAFAYEDDELQELNVSAR
jgi:hypothetical protein